MNSLSRSQDDLGRLALWMYVSGWMLVSSGFLHTILWLIVGGDWEGDVSWRKPILFGVSTGATMVSMGWVYPKLKSRRTDLVLIPAFAIAMSVEVGLISLQQWRGVASHFNRATMFDSLTDYSMTFLILLGSAVIVDLAWRCFKNLDANPAMALAIRSGMSLLVFSLFIGVVIYAHGTQMVALGKDPTVFGARGVVKFPHGVAIHAIQMFPIAIWGLSALGIAKGMQSKILKCLLASTISFFVFSLFQTLSGLSRFEFTWTGYGMLGISVVAFSGALFLFVIALRRRTSAKSKSAIGGC